MFRWVQMQQQNGAQVQYAADGSTAAAQVKKLYLI